MCFFSTSWKNQKFSQGSYTSIPVGATQEDIENIAQPLYSSPQHFKVSFFLVSYLFLVQVFLYVNMACQLFYSVIIYEQHLVLS